MRRTIKGVGSDEREGGVADGEESLAPSPNSHAESQTSYAFGCRWGVCVWQGRVSAERYKTSLPCGFGL